jgi:hypothetical protein
MRRITGQFSPGEEEPPSSQRVAYPQQIEQSKFALDFRRQSKQV